MESQRIYSLNIHASYRCRHSGACCSAGWAIPVEAPRQALLGAAVLLPDRDGVCRFYDHTDGLCRIHRDHGDNMLPESCRQFPRRARIDDRGTFVALSHFCPTAAALLVKSDGIVEVVASPSAFPSDRRYEGLDARGAWPPLVKADLLFDLDTYDRWERFLIATLGGGTCSATTALKRIAWVAERLRCWAPEFGPLAGWLQRECEREGSAAEVEAAWRQYTPLAEFDAYERLLAFVPEGLETPAVTDRLRQGWRASDPAAALPSRLVSRYVAARAFASWSAYEAFGVRTMVAELVLAQLVLRVEALRAWDDRRNPSDEAVHVAAVRAADLLLVHLVDRPALIQWLGRVESPSGSRRRF